MATNTMTATTVINHKRYHVEYIFNMVGNYAFTDKYGRVYLVDSEDVAIWADEQGEPWRFIYTAIAYAKYYTDILEDGVFWWKEK